MIHHGVMPVCNSIVEGSAREDMAKLDANQWGRFKSNLTHSINLSLCFIQEEITSGMAEEAKDNLAAMKVRYDALETALRSSPNTDFEADMEEIQNFYADAQAAVKKG